MPQYCWLNLSLVNKLAIGEMIKVCSLDYLNKKVFETDIMTKNGKVLVNSGENVTPEIILRLFFKEIYVEEIAETNKNEFKNAILEEGKEEALVSSKTRLSSDSAMVGGVATSEVIDLPKSSSKELDTENPTEEIKEAEPKAEADSEEISSEKISPESNLSFDIDSSSKSSKGTPKKSKLGKEDEEKEDENEPENQLLEFDQEQAKRISDNATKLGKLVGYSKEELKELEEAAYYCNIGITKFTKDFLDKKNFRKAKALEGYKILLNEKCMPENIAEAVKFSANNYDSDAFALDGKIPYNHVIAITSYYEDLLEQNQSKQTILLKMLQMGGNKFNIFVLHKFINMMKESAE